ncbi:MAG: N-acetyl-gamma-glutamyl-phosphate reductase [Actinomycetota bacterium]
MDRIGVMGASGFAGAELLRLCAEHPHVEACLAVGDTQAGVEVGALYPSLAAAYPGMSFTPYDPAELEGLDLLFLAMPHGESSKIMEEVRKRVPAVVDLGADFRLSDAALYPQWYGEEHPAPELLGEFVYGLPELFRDEVRAAKAIAAPGCYPTAAALALAPLVREGLIEPTGVVVDAASGVSGAGRGKYPYAGTNEDFIAYGLLDHRHTPEIEQAAGAQVIFTPHLAPMNRGILATCYARPAAEVSTTTVLEALGDFYTDEPFVVVSDRSPSTKATAGSNTAHLTARYDERTGWAVALCAIDNLVKGAAGQALQCANLSLGHGETEGLSVAGIYP